MGEGNERILESSRRFFDQIAWPSLQAEFPDVCERIAAGLVGNGSECFGFDDEISLDHDCGIRFYLWLTPDDMARFGDGLSAWKQRIAADHAAEWPFPERSAYGAVDGVMTVQHFYGSLIGFDRAPRTLAEWWAIPEQNLALATNGEVFRDPPGTFTSIREDLQAYYPEQLRLKRIASRCMAIAQTGQYNYLRCLERGDTVAKELALGHFVEETISLVFLLNRRYKPYYKWEFHALQDLPLLADAIAPLLESLYTTQPAQTPDAHRIEALEAAAGMQLHGLPAVELGRISTIEDICSLLAAYLRETGLSDAEGTFLADDGEAVQRHVTDPGLASMPAYYG